MRRLLLSGERPAAQELERVRGAAGRVLDALVGLGVVERPCGVGQQVGGQRDALRAWVGSRAQAFGEREDFRACLEQRAAPERRGRAERVGQLARATSDSMLPASRARYAGATSCPARARSACDSAGLTPHASRVSSDQCQMRVRRRVQRRAGRVFGAVANPGAAC